MNRQQFDFEFGKKHGVNSFQLTDTLTVFRKPYEIWNEETDESIYFKNVDELLNYEIEKSIANKLKPICDTFCVFDNTYKISFMHSYVSILFISTNTFTVIIPYESINKIKTWNDLIKFKMKGHKTNG